MVLSKAIAFKDGRHSRTLTVEKGDSFQILPYDASILFQNAEGTQLGPWYLVGGESSNDTALTIEKQQANREELDEAAKKEAGATWVHSKRLSQHSIHLIHRHLMKDRIENC